MNESDCPGHKYEHIKTEILTKEDGKKDGRYFTEYGKCIYCGKELVWSNFVDKTSISIVTDGETKKRIISIEEIPTVEEELIPLQEPYPHVPEELNALNNWVGWKLEEVGGKPTKIPYAQTGVKASSTDPASWRSFNDVCNIPPSKEKGIGFVFDGNGIIGIDLDHCLDENGNVNDKFLNIVSILKSYAEISPSGNGLHILIRCESSPYETGKKKGDLEIYSKERYFTVTGNKLPCSPDTIEMFPVELVRSLCDPFLNPVKKEVITRVAPSTSTVLTDDEIITIASRAKNSSKFIDLMDGKSCGDKSADDMALANILAFYSTDANQIERIMRMSGLVREKWNRHDYIFNYTIMKAINDCNGHYEPPVSNGDPDHGKEVSATIVSQPGKPPLPQPDIDPEDDSDGREKLAVSAEMTRLPPFPGTKHKVFGGWKDVASQISYSRTPFHYFTLMGLCTMILGKRTRVVLSGKAVYSNMFIQMLGTSSVSGKSFALDMTTDEGRFLPAIQNRIMKSITPDGNEIPSQNIQLCKFMIQTNKVMEPRLIQDLAKVNDNMIWYFDEAQTFYVGAANNNSSILPQLCLIYDGKTVKSKLSISKKKENDNQEYEWACEKPFVSLIFAMTDDQFDKLASSEQSEGGFLPRFMFVYEQGGEVKENVDISPMQQSTIDSLINEVQYVAEKLCLLNNDTISFRVCPRIERWKVEETNKHLGVEFTEKRIAIQRIFIQVYKMAMVLTIMDTEFLNNVILKNVKPNGHLDPIVLDLPEKWVEEALDISEKYLLPRMICVLQKASDVNVKSNMSKIMKVIKSNGGSLERHKIGRFTHIEKKLLEEALESLEENKEICKAVTLENGHKITRYCLVKD